MSDQGPRPSSATRFGNHHPSIMSSMRWQSARHPSPHNAFRLTRQPRVHWIAQHSDGRTEVIGAGLAARLTIALRSTPPTAER